MARRLSAPVVRAAMLLATLLSLLALLAPTAASAQPATRVQEIRPLAEGVWLLPGRFPRDAQPDGNSLILQGRDGLVLLDSGRHPEHAQVP